ncbi:MULTISPECIES: hypothetical protein [Roseateles]|uniref:Tryptophan-rich sensory protein n=1 Tax=Pelomonas aquatica TaxID=431058 RepID=A0ABU1ZE69_9BURK|nr:MULTISPECIES: hypothetical protein [Roseateles]MDR7298873.1 hypothetical protein [Pelomonas aquatica]
MTSRGQVSLGVFALLVPAALVIGREVLSGRSLLADPTTASLNWLFMAAPQLVALAVGAVNVRSRERFLPLALLLSAFVVVAFQAWILFFVPPREGALAWILYIPLWLIVLAVLAGVLVWQGGGMTSPNLPVQRTASPPADF